LRREIEDLLALVEFGLDFSDGDAGVLSAVQCATRLEHLHAQLAEFLGPAVGQDRRPANSRARCLSPEDGSAATESAILTCGLPRVLLLGPTNAGKSSLFNALLGRPAAIVSPQAHTTRDTVEAALAFPGAGTALLIDSAGWCPPGAQHAANLVRQSAWAATLSAVRAADVILLLLDRSVPAPETEELDLIVPCLAQAKPEALALVWTKSDLPPAADCGLRIAHCAGHLAWFVGRGSSSEPRTTNHDPLKGGAALPVAAYFEVSSVDGTGIPALMEFLTAKVAAVGAQPKDAYLAAAALSRAAARNAAIALARAREGLAAGHGEDAVAVELREALHAFWEAEGVLMKHDAVTEATLDRIFSRFCIGK
jgi:tRNA modification GTPase